MDRHIHTAIKVVSTGVKMYLNDTRNKVVDLIPKVSCWDQITGTNPNGMWPQGNKFHRYSGIV